MKYCRCIALEVNSPYNVLYLWKLTLELARESVKKKIYEPLWFISLSRLFQGHLDNSMEILVELYEGCSRKRKVS